MGNDASCKIVGIGTVRVKMHDGINLRVFGTFLIWAEILFQFLPLTVNITVIQVEVEC